MDYRIKIMKLTRGKIVIIPIFVIIFVGLVSLVAFTEWEEAEINPNVGVILENVKMKKIDDDNPDRMIVRVDLAVFNNTE